MITFLFPAVLPNFWLSDTHVSKEIWGFTGNSALRRTTGVLIQGFQDSPETQLGVRGFQIKRHLKILKFFNICKNHSHVVKNFGWTDLFIALLTCPYVTCEVLVLIVMSLFFQ